MILFCFRKSSRRLCNEAFPFFNHLGIRYFSKDFKERKGINMKANECTKLQSTVSHYQGFQDISTIEECKVAAKELNTMFSHVWSHDSFPKRCHIMYSDISGNDIVYWNSHKDGDNSIRSSPICKIGALIDLRHLNFVYQII